MIRLIGDIVVAVAATLAILDYFGLKPKQLPAWHTMPLSRRWKLAIMLVLVAAALGMSGYSFYRALRPKIVERIVEKEKPMPVATPCPEPPKASGPAKTKASPSPQVSKPPETPHQQQSGKDNAQTGPITQGPCSNAQVGGSNNQATTNCGQSAVTTTYNYDGSQRKTISGGTVHSYFDNPDPMILKIQEELKAGQQSEALTDAQSLMKSEPYWATPHVLAGIAYVNLRNVNAAKSELSKAKELAPPGYEFEQDYASHLQHLEEMIKRRKP